ncbi:MAG: endonuclease/exonuclease/phosphatase family protein [Actinomycetota bacterium]
MSSLPPGARRRHRVTWLGAAAVAAPWLWFVVRTAGGPIDAIGVALPVFGVVGALTLFVLSVILVRPILAAVGVSVVAVTLIATLAPRMPRPTAFPNSPLRVTSANVYEFNKEIPAAVDVLVRRQPDILGVVEMRRDGTFWSALSEQPEFPYGVTRGELGLRARFPVTELETPGNLNKTRVLRVAVDGPYGRLIVYVVHGLNPLHDTTFQQQRDFTERLIGDLWAEADPAILMGDMNMSDRTLSYRILDGSFLDAMRTGGWPRSTYHGEIWPIFQLRIDHLFIPQDWCGVGADTYEVPGSDHDGIEAVIGPCPA